jgi:FixJ family two-component response regulator
LGETRPRSFLFLPLPLRVIFASFAFLFRLSLLLCPMGLNRESAGDRSLIAVVDDDAGTRVALARLLRQHGFVPLTFNSGDAFLQAQVSNPVACVLLDLMMPGLSGFETKAKLDASGPQLPAILITANAEPELCARAEREGFVACLTKPCVGSQLIPVINQALRRPT